MSAIGPLPSDEVHAVVNETTAELSVLGNQETLTGTSYVDVRTKIMDRVMRLASELGSDVLLVVHDQTGRWRLVAQPDGQIREDDPEADPVADPAGDLSTLFPPLPAPPQPAPPAPPQPAPPPPPLLSQPAPLRSVPLIPRPVEVEPPLRRTTRDSFIIDEWHEPAAIDGWRGLIARTTGLKVPASASEMERRRCVQAVSQHWPGPRKIAVVNGKGGVGKTLTDAMLAAVFARNGGAGVLAWDNNDTRGTLGWRTEKGPHDATVHELLTAAGRLLSPSAQAADLARFVHHQTSDKYDVLRSNPELLAANQRISEEDFDALHEVAAKYFRLVFFDSGNDESSPRWLRMIDHTDQLVVATTALGEPAESGALLLEALEQRDERSAELARNAVVVVLQSERKGTMAEAQRFADGFAGLARAAVTIPFDLSLHGGALRFDSLNRATQNAWLAAAAAVADGL